MGFTWENDTHLFYRRAKASEIAFGDATFHRERIAKLVIDTDQRETNRIARWITLPLRYDGGLATLRPRGDMP